MSHAPKHPDLSYSSRSNDPTKSNEIIQHTRKQNILFIGSACPFDFLDSLQWPARTRCAAGSLQHTIQPEVTVAPVGQRRKRHRQRTQTPNGAQTRIFVLLFLHFCAPGLGPKCAPRRAIEFPVPNAAFGCIFD